MAKALLCIMRTFGWSDPTVQSFRTLVTSQSRHDWGLSTPPPDAAVDRAREGVAVEFLSTDREVLVMVDADVSWSSNEDIEYIVDKAVQLHGVVGGVVSKRNVGAGWGCRLADGEPHELYSDEIVELGEGAYMGSAFVAIHRDVFLKIIEDGIPWCPAQRIWPFFTPLIVFNDEAGYPEKVSEDWAFCYYARKAGAKVYAAMKPVTFHHGKASFTALDGARPAGAA